MPQDRCGVLRRVCVDKGTLVTFDPKYAYDSGSSLPPLLPYLPCWRGSWNIPGATNSDAIVGNQVDYALRLRRASRAESSPSFAASPSASSSASPNASSSSSSPNASGPAFSRCTLPVVLLTDWPFNFGEFFANAAGGADQLFRRMGMLRDRAATLVLATPSGLGLMAFHRALLGHLTTRPILTLDELSADAEAAEAAAVEGREAPRVGWAAEGVPVSCFERMVICKLEGSPQPPLITAAAVAQHMLTSEPGLPTDPLGFFSEGHAASAATAGEAAAVAASAGALDAAAEAAATLRVVVEARAGGARTIRNLHSLLDACAEPGWQGGPFTRLSCRALPAFDTPSLHGTARFRAAVAAVRSAHVYVAVHGAGAANAFFLTPDAGTGGGGGPPTARALLEIRPCGFGSGYPWWVDVHLAVHLPRSGDQIRFHAYNIEDPAQCSPPDWAVAADAASAAGDAVNLRAGLGHRQRDQHLTLRPDGFRAMLSYVASMLRDPAAYEAAKAAGRLHGYALPYGGAGSATPSAGGSGGGGGEGGAGGAWGPSGGIVLGPLGLANFTEHAAAGAKFLLPPG